jgi:hypothetical protein
MSSSDEEYKDEPSDEEEEEEEEWVEDADDEEDEEEVNHRKFGKDLSNKRKRAPKKRAPAQKKNQQKRKGRSSCRAKKGCGDDDDDGGSLENFLIVEKREGEKPLSNIILSKEDIFTKYDSFIVGDVDKKEEAKMVLRHLVKNGLVISDPNLGDGCFVQDEVTTMLESGLLTTKHDPVDQKQRSSWFGSAYCNNPHNMKILQASSFCMTFLQNALEDTGGIICNVFAQYILTQSNANGHFGFHQDNFVGNQYRLLLTLGDSKEGKRMTFSICDEIPSDENPGQQVTLSIPHGRAVLLNRYVSATLQ